MRYQISSYDLLKQMLSESDDNPLHPWDAYPCLEWPRQRNADGYGKVYARHAMRTVSREAYVLAVEVLPDNVFALHHCDNPPCFRPIHLFAGSDHDNMQDCMAKGRLKPAFGERSGAAVLTEARVQEIRKLCAEGVTHREIASLLGIGKSTVGYVTKMRTWTHVPGTPAPTRSSYAGIPKLIEEQVIEIRRLGSDGWTYQQLAARFKVTEANIAHIIRRLSWKHI